MGAEGASTSMLAIVDRSAVQQGWELLERMGNPKYVCAPMVEGSELAFRMMIRKYNVHLCYTPMINARMFVNDSNYRRRVFSTCEGDRPLAIQFCANDPHYLLRAAKMVESQADFIDINLGCPQRIARRGHYGAFLLDHPETIHALVASLRENLSVPVSCKIRLLKTDEETLSLARMLQRSGCSLLTVHGRTRDEIGPNIRDTNLQLIKRIKEELDIPVFTNGGVETREDADAVLAFTGADAVMASEGLLSNPSMFSMETPNVNMLDLAEQYAAHSIEFDASSRQRSLHLCKILYRAMCEYSDVRDAMGNGHGDLVSMQTVVDRVRARIATNEYERERLRIRVSWYRRHWHTLPCEAKGEWARHVQAKLKLMKEDRDTLLNPNRTEPRPPPALHDDVEEEEEDPEDEQARFLIELFSA